jgi:enoyl-CoA hydratase/carnithine racemase
VTAEEGDDAGGSTEPVVVVEDDGAVRIVRFNRPGARNAFNGAMYDAVTDALTEAAALRSVHVVVLTGNGSAFSAGQDLKEMARIVSGEVGPETARGFRGLLDAVGSFDKPLLAAVNGVGVGLGFTLLLHCDLVLMADDARLRVPFAELGVPPEAASSYLFPRTLGWQRAAKLLFTGGWLGAAEAVEAGVAVAACPAASLIDETLALARAIAAAPLDALMTSKRLLLATRTAEVAEARRREDAAFAELLGTDDNVAALQRFETDPGAWGPGRGPGGAG